jgi:hypothetical protein
MSIVELDQGISKRITDGIRWSFAAALDLFGGDEEMKQRIGAYFCVADLSTGKPVLISLLGTVLEEKAPKYLELCQEKPDRLRKHPKHVSSWQSRDPASGKWAGAVKVGGHILSMSGFPEMLDEAVCLRAAYLFESQNFLDQIALISSNPYWAQLRAA